MLCRQRLCVELEAHSGLLGSVAPPGDGSAADLRADWEAVSGRLLKLQAELLTLTAAGDQQAEVGTARSRVAAGRHGAQVGIRGAGSDWVAVG